MKIPHLDVHAMLLDPSGAPLPIPSRVLPGLMVAPALTAQAPALPELSAEEWQGLRALVVDLGTEPGTREVFRRHPQVAQRFPSLDHFLDYVAKWRPALAPLPDTVQKALEAVDIQVLDKPDGTAIYLTYYLNSPPNALVHLRTTWVNGTLTRMECLKGFARPRG